ncbi:hypothetical protein OSC27_12455 [Microbacterium sp. STN6]|uniref:hypothetical protein n=1 Tax=Microbacterium sp. STN6 TaxID=2995588 RepID=UPI002260F049|nr:hypothetical protein [Microbacterium sp. STN6]MCX7523083.1 hypothetical protein [Microbacterium sp. STN6]
MADGEETEISVAATDDVGSQRLASALAAQDVAAIGQALRHDMVVVPLLPQQSGDSQIRVFESADTGGPAPYDLCLFSSTAALALYLGESEIRQFALRRGASLQPFLEQYASVIDRVVFDPAGPHPIAASPEDVLLSLRPQPGDDDVAWAASVGAPARESESLDEFPADADPTRSRVVGLDIALSGDWFVITLTDEKERDAQIAALVKKQLARVESARRLRAELERWLRSACQRAASGGGRFLAFLLQRTREAALALNVAMYWHELGPAIGDTSHLERMTQRLRGELENDDELLGAESDAGPFVRHTRVTRGAGEVGGSELPLVVIDYWLAFPDSRGLSLLSFSSPHVEQRAELQRLADNIVLRGAWVLESAAGS